jgi:hypothetical protein
MKKKVSVDISRGTKEDSPGEREDFLALYRTVAMIIIPPASVLS